MCDADTYDALVTDALAPTCFEWDEPAAHTVADARALIFQDVAGSMPPATARVHVETGLGANSDCARRRSLLLGGARSETTDVDAAPIAGRGA